MIRPTWSRFLPAAILLGFTAYFSFDIVTLRKVLLHPDIYTYYYPFRQWFIVQLRDFHFPLWNPYWGLGQAVEVWSSIPLDLYTPLELLVGPYYHVYQALQLLALLAAVAYTFRRLDVPPLPAAAGAIFFFMSPLVTYWYFSFLIVQVYVAYALLFLFLWQWYRDGRRRALFLIALTTALSMLGTKVEFWFYQTAAFAFLALAIPMLTGAPRPLRRALHPLALALLALATGIAANLWQLNILLRLIRESGRLSDPGLFHLVRPELYRNLGLSLLESPLLQLLLLALLVILALRLPRRARLLPLVGLAVAAVLLWRLGALHLGFAPVPSFLNASFETWVESPAGPPLPLHFAFTPQGPGCTLARTLDPALVHDTPPAAALLTPPASGQCFLRAEVGPVERFRGRPVRLSLWARSANTATSAIKFDLQDGLGPASVVALPLSPDWQHLQVERTVDPNAQFLLLTFNVTARATAPLALDQLHLTVARAAPALSRRDYSLSQLLTVFATGPVLLGLLLAAALAFTALRDRDWRQYLVTSALFAPFLFYWCRPENGYLDETQIMAMAPSAFIALLAALTWLGCRRLGADPLVIVAYASILFVFLMRDQGQILLAYLSGLLWMPTRDNYIVDFAIVLIGTRGLLSLSESLPTLGLRTVAPLAAIAIAVAPASGNLYYSQILMRLAPPGAPFYQGVPALRAAFHELGRTDGAPTRVHLANHDAWGFTYGFGEALLERVGQVTMYDSLTSQRYKDWTIFHQLGIKPEQHWGGYPGNYSPAVTSRLPRKNTLNQSNSTYYHYTVIARPPIRQDLLALLGVSHLVKLHPITGPDVVESIEPDQLDREVAALEPRRLRPLTGIAHPGVHASTAIAELAPPLPRAFLVYDVSPAVQAEFEQELSPRLLDGALATASHRLPLAPARLLRYDAEHVTVEATASRDAVLVLGDLHHPFWTATVDGRPADILPALHLFRGVRLAPGIHRVDFTCRVPGMTAAVVASLFTVALGTVLFLRCRRRADF